MTRLKIHILVLDGVFDMGLAAVLDAFGVANTVAEMTGVSSLRFETKVLGLRKTITTAQGLGMAVAVAAKAEPPDVVVMPAIGKMQPGPLVEALTSGEVRGAGAMLR